ncbi:hypothetical protein DAI22_04g117300 [Oryza sativa Japonica Group]|uniref:DUF7054 domain-containing protein n=2 Tax=Oryza TaxID=4527 RepID=A0A0E0H0C2_ORYNI|nr:hypothetical protein DAI22_04g117300 [Oryza sativa Japonica Group]CAH66514.1 OSIGBa0142C11.2 [Oryza sativa]
MPPLTPHIEKGYAGGRQSRQQEASAAAAAAAAAGGQLLLQRGPGQRSASFHGRGTEPRHQLARQRPKTQPDLLAGVRGRATAASFGPAAAAGGGEQLEPEAAGRRTPSKVLVSVAVQRSLWPLHVMASAAWSVADLVAAAVALYVKEGRRPPLPSADPSDFGLHYSQFSLESLDPREKVMELGSRSFFLCPKSSAAVHAPSPSCSSDEASRIRDRDAPAAARAGAAPAWVSYMQFWPMM